MRLSTTEDRGVPLGAPATLSPPRQLKRIRQGSPQQEAFWRELRDGTSNVLLEARAGTGKSSSCREGMWRILEDRPRSVIRYCCFNKAIADEFSRDCPPGVSVGTMHRFGLEVIQSRTGIPVIDKNKTYTVLDATPEGKTLPRYVRKAVATLVSLAKNHAYLSDSVDIDRKLHDLIFRFDVECWRREDLVIGFAKRVLEMSARIDSVVDFDDMLWLPVIHGHPFSGVDLLMIDEVQDLNPVQHAMVEQLAGSGRIVIVGDPYQAIYGWRGAAVDSVATLRDRLGCTTLPLTVSWRCPESHARFARQWVGDFEAAPGAAEGTLIHGDLRWIEVTRPGDMVLCRLNAPLIHACLEMIARHVPAKVRGRSIGEGLASIARLASTEATVDSDMRAFHRGLEAWRTRNLVKYQEVEGMEDRIEEINDQHAALSAIATSVDSTSQVFKVILDLFSDSDPGSRVIFSSIHRAKGSEAERVFWMTAPYSEMRDKAKPPAAWQLQQRDNLNYVAATRSQDFLVMMPI